MDTPQGNFTAYQQLKPTELKVGDIYNKAIDELIKNNQAQQAAALKQKMQQNQSLDKLMLDIGDSFKGGIKTISALSTFASDYTNQAASEYGDLFYKANTTTDPAEKQIYTQKALRLKNGYEALKASMQSMDFDSIARQDADNLAKGKIWAGDENIYARQLFSNGLLKPIRGEDGNFYVAVPKGANAKPDDPAEMVPINDFFSRYYGRGLEVDTSEDVINAMTKQGRDARDSSKASYSKDGNGTMTYTRTLSDKDRAGILNQYFQMNKDDFDINRVNRGIYQLFYNQTGRYMANYDDYLATRQIVDNIVKSRVGQDIRTEQTLKTPNITIHNHNGDKATGESLSNATDINVFVKDKNGKVFSHNMIVVPTSRGGGGEVNNNLAVAYDKSSRSFKFYEVVRNKTGELMVASKEVRKDVAVNLLKQNVGGKANASKVLNGLMNSASYLKANKQYYKDGSVNMNSYESTSKIGSFGG